MGASTVQGSPVVRPEVQTSFQWRSWIRRPAAIPAMITAYLLLCYLAVLLVDVFGLWGVQAWLGAHANQPLLWYYLFVDGGPTELLQWSTLAATAIMGGMLVGRLQVAGEQTAARFWILIAVTAGILAIEDPADWRTPLSLGVTRVFGVDAQHPLRDITMGVYYAAISSVPVYAVLRYGRVVWDSPARVWFFAGMSLYALAAMGSVTRYVGGYEWLGGRIDRLAGGRLGDGFIHHFTPQRPPGWWLVDLVIEESMELMAAALLLTAVVAYGRFHRTRLAEDDQRSPQDDGAS